MCLGEVSRVEHVGVGGAGSPRRLRSKSTVIDGGGGLLIGDIPRSVDFRNEQSCGRAVGGEVCPNAAQGSDEVAGRESFRGPGGHAARERRGGELMMPRRSSRIAARAAGESFVGRRR